MSTELTKKTDDLPATTRRREYVRPRYNVGGDEHAFEVKVYLPGVPRDGATVTVDQRTLTVEAERPAHAGENWRRVHQEIPTADFRLRLQLNLAVDESKISASSMDGVLTIRLPIAEESKPRTIAIS